ncbi:MAG: phosphoribosyltransferase [Planctomycetes bacterium]|nr:phosphoribosyltransferase [Planctomycetota bacterium]
MAERLKGLPHHRPLVLAIPRGGIEVAVPIAQALHADLDVVLARKLRSPTQRELALGAVSETGEVHLNNNGRHITEAGRAWIEKEKAHQRKEIDRLRQMVRSVRPLAGLADRTVIVVDDGVATGATLLAALRTARSSHPRELVAAVPVGPKDRLTEIRSLADRVVCLQEPDVFWAVGQFYRRFEQVSDERVLQLLRENARAGQPDSRPVARARAAGSSPAD